MPVRCIEAPRYACTSRIGGERNVRSCVPALRKTSQMAAAANDLSGFDREHHDPRYTL